MVGRKSSGFSAGGAAVAYNEVALHPWCLPLPEIPSSEPADIKRAEPVSGLVFSSILARSCSIWAAWRPMNDVTRILSAVEQGDSRASEQLLPLVYEELRKLAVQKLAQEKPGQTLQATALVHEAYLRLVPRDGNESGAREERWDGRGHFFAAAAEAMRRILVDQARRRHAAKRGGLQERVQMPESSLAAPLPDEELLALHEALEQLAGIDPAAADLVRLRFFAGLKTTEAAAALGLSVRSAHDLWAYARSWLRRKTKGD